jgi:hypothetical protein
MFQVNPLSVPVTDQVGPYLVKFTVSISYQISAPELNMKIYMVVIQCLCPLSHYKNTYILNPAYFMTFCMCAYISGRYFLPQGLSSNSRGRSIAEPKRKPATVNKDFML